MGTTVLPLEIAEGVNEFFLKWGLNRLKMVPDVEDGVIDITFGSVAWPLRAAILTSEYNDLVTYKGYSSSDAIQKIGSEILGGIVGGLGAEALGFETPVTAAAAAAVGPWLGSTIGGDLFDLLRSLPKPATAAFSPASTGFTATPIPIASGPAGVTATTSSQLPSGNSHGIKVSAMLQAESDGYYVVQAGNTLSDIANTFGTTMGAIMQANPSITNAKMIYAGQQITLPTGATNWLTELGKQSREITDFLKSATEPMKTVRENIRENMIFNDAEVPEPGDVESTSALKRSSLDALAERVLSRRIWRPEWVPIKTRPPL